MQKPPPKDSLLGKRIREYEILEILGQGGMGAVYRARHVYLEEERAIKVIQTRLAKDPNFVHRFIREARILTRMRHPNLVQLYEFGTLDDDVFFMVMELLKGESLLTRLRREKRIAVTQSARIIRQAALGLHSAHQKGIVHRDLSPDNLFLIHSDGREVTKVIDFGIAKPNFDLAGDLTRTGFFLGKPEYSSPEQCGLMEEGGTIDRRSDIYSLGVTLYHMLSGKLPFHSATPQGYVLKHATEIPPPVSSILQAGEITPAVDALLLKMMAKKRHDRYATMEDVIRELDSIFPPTSDDLLTQAEIPIQEIGEDLLATEQEPTIEKAQVYTPDPQPTQRGNVWPAGQSTAVAPPAVTPPPASPSGPIPHSTVVDLPGDIRLPLWLLISGGVMVLVGVLTLGWWFFSSRGGGGGPAGLQAGTTANAEIKTPLPVTINALPWAKVTVRPISVQADSAQAIEQTATTPCYFMLPEGEYQIELTNHFGPPIRQTIEVHPGSLNEFAFRMPSYDPQQAVDEVESR